MIQATSTRTVRLASRALSSYVEPGILFSATCTDPRLRRVCWTNTHTTASTVPEQGILLFSMPSITDFGIKGGHATPGNKTLWDFMVRRN